MDTTAQDPAGNDQQNTTVQPVNQQQVQDAGQASAPTGQPSQSASQGPSTSITAGKESAPRLPTTSPDTAGKPQTTIERGDGGQAVISPVKPAEQWFEETAPKANLSPDVAEAGVEATKGEVLEVAPDVAQAGVKATGAATPIPSEPTFHFPMTEEEAKKKSSGPGKTKLSAAWLAMLVLRQIKILQFQKKKEEKKK